MDKTKIIKASIIENLDELGLPARHLLDMGHYTQRSKWLIRGVSVRGTSIFTTRGCCYNCTFCSGKIAFGSRVRFHSVGHVIREIEHLIEKYKVDGIYFADDMFSSYKPRAMDICDEIIRRGINKKMVFAVQLTAKAGCDKELLLKLKEAGCIQCEYGFESGSQRMLNLMKKSSTVENNYMAARLTREVGLRFVANIIVGMPSETKEDFMASIEFLKKTKPDMAAFCKLILLPGCELYNTYPPANPNWENFLQSDTTENLTAMPDDIFFPLFKKWGKWVSRQNAIRYLNYNLRKDFFGTLIETGGLIWKKLKR